MVGTSFEGYAVLGDAQTGGSDPDAGGFGTEKRYQAICLTLSNPTLTLTVTLQLEDDVHTDDYCSLPPSTRALSRRHRNLRNPGAVRTNNVCMSCAGVVWRVVSSRAQQQYKYVQPMMCLENIFPSSFPDDPPNVLWTAGCWRRTDPWYALIRGSSALISLLCCSTRRPIGERQHGTRAQGLQRSTASCARVSRSGMGGGRETRVQWLTARAVRSCTMSP